MLRLLLALDEGQLQHKYLPLVVLPARPVDEDIGPSTHAERLQRIEGRLESAELVGADAFVQLDALGENEGDLKLAAWQQPRVQSRKRFGVT
jgi:hypothetical protein